MTDTLTNKELVAKLEKIGQKIGRTVPKSLIKAKRDKIESYLAAWSIELEEMTKAEKPSKKTEEKKPKEKKATIKSLACDKLAEVLYVNEEGRTVGKAYDRILKEILEENPTVNTSINCLRWYANKIRGDFAGYEKWKLPQLRERMKKDETSETSEA